MSENNELVAAGRLIQWGLNPRARSTLESEYRQLLDKYSDHLPFRTLVSAIAEGLGLQILDVSSRGIILVPLEGSIFASQPSDYRSSTGADDRLLDGLVQIAILATVYPLSQDLQEDPAIVRPAITVEDVEATLRNICDRLEEQSRQQPDPTVNNLNAGIYEAWRVYRDRSSAKTTGGQRVSAHTTSRLIERALEFLQQQGCFMSMMRGTNKEYRPTWKYQVMQQDWSATRLYEIMQSLLKIKEM